MVCTYIMLRYMNPDSSRTQTPHVMLYEILETWKSDSVICLTSSLYSTIGFSELKIIRPAKSILCLSFACFLENPLVPVPHTVSSESVSRLQCWGRNDIFAAILPTPSSRSYLPVEVTHTVFTRFVLGGWCSPNMPGNEDNYLWKEAW